MAVFSLLYLVTCQRGASWQDSGMFQRRVLDNDYEGSLGLALAHPLYIAAGRGMLALPVGRFTTRLNFFSGLGMAIALANLMAVVTLLTGRRWIGLGAAAMLAVSHTVWWLSTIAEVYTWSVAGLTGELWLLVLLVRRPNWRTLAALALVSGLGLAIHNFALLPLPVYLAVAVVLIRKPHFVVSSPWSVAGRPDGQSAIRNPQSAVPGRLPAWSPAAAAGTWCFGASPYLAMIARHAADTGSFAGAVKSALVGDYSEQVLNVAAVSGHAWENMALMAMNFVSFLAPLAVVGFVVLRRRVGSHLAAAIGAITVIHVVFVARYNVPDQFTFLLPTLMMIAIAAALGLAELAERSSRWRIAAITACGLSIALPPVLYGVAPAMARAAGAALPERQRFRDELRYWLVPWKHNEDSAERFARVAVEQASPDGVILTDSTAGEPMLLVQRRQAAASAVTVCLSRGEIALYESSPTAFRAALGTRALYLSKLPTGKLADDAEFARGEDDALYHLVRWRHDRSP